MYKTVRFIYGMSLRNRIADFLHRHGLIRIVYSVPIVNVDGNKIGEVATCKGGKKALWLVSVLFKQEENVQMFALSNDGQKVFEVK